MAKSPTRSQKTAKRATPKPRGPTSKAAPKSKLDLIVAALRAPRGATISQLSKLTAWQPHSVRGAMAGALKKRGLKIGSIKTDGERIYRIEASK